MMWGTGITRFGTEHMLATPYHADWMVVLMFLVPLVLLGIIVWLVLRNTGHLVRPNAPTPATSVPVTPDRAEVIVRERFARGEIDRDEYDRLITALRG